MALALDRPRTDRHGEDRVHTSRSRPTGIPNGTRLAVLVGLVTLPAVAAVVMSSVFVSTRRRLRALVPRRLKAGRRHHAQKKFQAALREYNEAIQTSPQLAEAYFRRGSLYLTMGEKALALADFERAIERDPRLRRLTPARQDVPRKRRLRLGPRRLRDADDIRANDPETHLNRGICLLKKGLVSEAAADFQRVLKLTNHSDFAEPAKQYLARVRIEQRRVASLPPAPTARRRAASSSEPTAPEFMI